jgi:hypothetical protein
MLLAIAPDLIRDGCAIFAADGCNYQVQDASAHARGGLSARRT